MIVDEAVTGLIELGKAMRVTLGYFFTKPITVNIEFPPLGTSPAPPKPPKKPGTE